MEMQARLLVDGNRYREYDMTIALASDHAGFDLKQQIIEYLKGITPPAPLATLPYPSQKGGQYKDFGCYSTDPIDYTDTGILAAESVARGECEFGILICGTGLGMSMIANKVKGVRASLCQSTEFARMTREHNDANVLVLAGRYTEPITAIEIVKTFFNTSFSGDERHIRRINKIKEYENKLKYIEVKKWKKWKKSKTTTQSFTRLCTRNW